MLKYRNCQHLFIYSLTNISFRICSNALCEAQFFIKADTTAKRSMIIAIYAAMSFKCPASRRIISSIFLANRTTAFRVCNLAILTAIVKSSVYTQMGIFPAFITNLRFITTRESKCIHQKRNV